MSAQDRLERVLRDLYILLSNSEVYDNERNLIILDKNRMIYLLTSLSKIVYEMKDEYELTVQSRDRAEREARKRGENIIAIANHQAEDVYAASMLYSDESLKRVQDIMQGALEAVKGIFDKVEADLEKEKMTLHEDQSELRDCLSELRDTRKYINIIEDRNRQIEKEKQRGRQRLKGKAMQEKKALEAEKTLQETKPEVTVQKNEETLRETNLAEALQEPEEAVLEKKVPEMRQGADEAEKEPQKDKETGVQRDEESNPKPYTEIKPEIKINESYFLAHGIPLEEEKPFEEEKKQEVAEISVNLDSEYFRWKEREALGKDTEEPSEEIKEEKRTFWGKFIKR